MFNRFLLAACISVVVALILYMFYWNRFLAFFIGLAIRLLYWNQEASSIWVEIGSIHFSLLAGRILLKDVRYHSSNQTLKIVKAQIQWRYWIRRPSTEEDIHAPRDEEAKFAASLWNCRVQVSLHGLEWLIYNKTAAYDAIVAEVEKLNRTTSRTSSKAARSFIRRGMTLLSSYTTTRGNLQGLGFTLGTHSSGLLSRIHTPNAIRKALVWIRFQLPQLDPKDLLPLGIDVERGAIIIGNPSTPSLLVAEFRHAVGNYGALPAKSRYDLYKQSLNLQFDQPLIQLVRNDDYVDPMSTIGSLIHNRVRQSSLQQAPERPSFYQSYRTFLKLFRQISLYDLTLQYLNTRQSQRRAQRNKPELSANGSGRKTDETNLTGIDFSTFEYAVDRKILEASSLDLTYYVDVVGLVPQEETRRSMGNGIYDVGNGDSAPEWGIHLVVHGGSFHYGPWADRQRAELQKAFFPPTYQKMDVSEQLNPGESRVWTALQIFVEFRGDTNFQIPFREASKDWQWDGEARIPNRPKKREAAALNISVGDSSSLSYVMPMVVGPEGYESTLEVHLDSVKLTSSLNDIQLISAESCRVRCAMPTPLLWNTERTWTFAVFLRQPSLYLLRDHINMFTDLSKDWTSGPPTDYQKFVPMIYLFQLEMHHFQVNLYVNDQNIIDKPLNRDENAFVVLKGSHLRLDTRIPSNVYRPDSSCISFSLTSPDLALDMSLPRWNAHTMHMPKNGAHIARSGPFNLAGSYTWYSDVRPDLIEQMKLDIKLANATLVAYGWAIRYFMVLRDNYLGSFTHFQTLHEYLEKRRRDDPVGDPITLQYRPGKHNDMQVELLLQADSPTILLPKNLLGSSSSKTNNVLDGDSLYLKTPEIQLHLRLHDYYLDMSLNIDPILVGFNEMKLTSLPLSPTIQRKIMSIDGLDITANRLFGPKPRTATYVCIWEIRAGAVKTMLTIAELNLLLPILNAFRLNFVDLLNAPANDFTPLIDPDVTFYKVAIKEVTATVKAGSAAMVVQLPRGLKVDHNDLSTQLYHKITSLKVPDISVHFLLTSSPARNIWLEASHINLSFYADIYSVPQDHSMKTQAQRSFIAEQDKPTQRAKRIFDALNDSAKAGQGFDSHKSGLFLPQPTVPKPTTRLIPQTRPVVHRRASPSRNPLRWRLSSAQHITDSEGEERVSEADRDARLAQNRLPTPMIDDDYEDELAMSSGDESDDADLTEGGSSEDEWSSAEDGSPRMPRLNTLLSFYSHLVPHYSLNWLDNPRTWHREPWSQVKVSSSFPLPQMSADEATQSRILPLLSRLGKQSSSTILRVICPDSIQITGSPLIIPAVSAFKDSFAQHELDAGVMLDSFLSDQISEATDSKGSSNLAVDLDIPSASFVLLHHIVLSEKGHPKVPKSFKETKDPNNVDIAGVIRLTLQRLKLSAAAGADSSAFQLHLGGAHACFDRLVDKKRLPSTGPSLLELCFSNILFTIDRTAIGLWADEILLKTIHEAPEMVVAASLSLGLSGRKLFRLLHDSGSAALERKKQLMLAILKATEQQAVVDPLSVVQPSYLVGSGYPHLLRTSIPFKLLFHLRNGIWNLKGFAPAIISDCPSSVPLLELLQCRLAALDQDTFDMSHLGVMDGLLGSQDSEELKDAMIQPFDIFTIQLGSIRAVVSDPQGGFSSELHFDQLRLKVNSRGHELLQMPLNSSSASQNSLRSRSSRAVRHFLVNFSLGNSTFILAPHLTLFTEHVLRVKRQFNTPPADSRETRARKDSDKASGFPSPIISLQVTTEIQSLRIKAAAENLLLVLGLESFQATFSGLVVHGEIVSTSLNLRFKELYLQARSPRDFEKQTEQDILAVVALLDGVVSAVVKPESGSVGSLKLLSSMNTFKINIPRSALRLYRFVEEWRADYLPGLEAAINTLLSEYNAGPKKAVPSTSSRKTRKAPEVQLHLEVCNAQILLQVMHGTWLTFEIQNTVAYAHSLKVLRSGFTHAFGLQNTSISVRIDSKQDTTTTSKVKVTLPPFSLSGGSDGFHIESYVLFDFIDLRVKPSHWDTLLAVQQKFGQDFNDLLVLIQRTRDKANATPQVPSTSPKGNNFLYRVHVKMRGFRLGLMGVPSALYLECHDINGNVSNQDGWAWDLALSDLAFSLTPRNAQLQGNSFNRNQRSAFVVLDFSGSNSTKAEEKSLDFVINKTQAVMQPSSVGELGDFIDNLQAEMLEREEKRAMELAAFKEKTQKILETFDVNINDVQLEQASWVNSFTIKFSIQNIGVAFPLIHSEEIEIPRKKSRSSLAVRAFLFTVKSVDFRIQKGETGRASMNNLCFQFVPRFRQSSPDDFHADNHQTRNRLLYPEMKAHLRSSLSASARKIWVEANVSGFVLDIDSSIPNYVFSLIDVYRHGKERVERLSANVPKTPVTARPTLRPATAIPDKQIATLPASHIFSKLVFMSGKVRLYSTSALSALKSKSLSLNPTTDFSDQQLMGAGVQVFNLPMLSVWAEYRAMTTLQQSNKIAELEPSILLFQSTVHSSQNVLSPTLLPFVTEVVNQVETRMRKVSTRHTPPSSTIQTSSSSYLPKEEEPDSMSSMQISFSLRIDKSKLELTCQPDVNVIAGVHWESGGFMLNVSPGSKKISFSGSVAGLTLGLKHGFLSEDCVKLDTRNLGFSVSFIKTGPKDGAPTSVITVVLDTELLGVVRFSRLQDVLCFKAVWLDRIPVLNSQTPAEPPHMPLLTPETSDKSTAVSTMVLVRIREIKLNVDLGQSISSINLNLTQTVFRTKLTDDLKEVYMYVADLTMTASGNISGHVRVPTCVFQTTRRSETSIMLEGERKKTLELRLTSGALVAVIESDQQKLLHYRADPLEVEISDDWSLTGPSSTEGFQPLQLSFTVNSPEIVAVVTVVTIPKILSYFNKFKANLDSQRQGAAKESMAFRSTRTPKPENPLSTVAEAMLHSARAKFKETESGTPFAVTQHMILRLGLLRLIVFPRSIRDGEVAQFIGRQVFARLDRLGAEGSGAKRDIHLSFSSMTISKYSQVAHVPSPPLNSPDGDDVQEWLRRMFKNATEANIVGLPAMQMRMVSDESVDNHNRIIEYDFNSKFIRREGMKEFEDIYITLNMSLYSWLTLLRKNLTREMDQVRAAEDWRVSLLNPPLGTQPSAHIQRKKKVPEPLLLREVNGSPSLATEIIPPPVSLSAKAAETTDLHTSTPPVSPPVQFPSKDQDPPLMQGPKLRSNILYRHRTRTIERLNMRQLGEATPDVMHPFFMKKAGFNLEVALPQYVNEYATVPLEEIMEVLLKLYSRQLLSGGRSPT